jgi:hypothetical protein
MVNTNLKIQSKIGIKNIFATEPISVDRSWSPVRRTELPKLVSKVRVTCETSFGKIEKILQSTESKSNRIRLQKMSENVSYLSILPEHR